MATIDHARALVRGFIDNSLSVDEHAALESHLRDPEVAKHFLRELHLDHAIRVAARSQDLRADIEAAPTTAPATTGTGRLRARRTPRWRPAIRQGSLLRIAAVLAVLALPAWLALNLTVLRPPTAELVVHLGTVEIAGEARNGVVGVDDGQELAVSPRGWASLRLHDGTLIELTGGTRVGVSSSAGGMRIALTAGSVQADVRKQPPGRPLVITSPWSRATVVGTRLSYATTETGDRLEVREGLVRLARSRDGDSIDVPAGQAVALAHDGHLALQPIRPPVAPVPEPPQAGLVLWFDPAHGVTRDDQGRVVRWDDRSGHGKSVANESAESRPLATIDGRPLIRFAMRNSLLTGKVPWPATGAFTVAVSMRARELGRWSQCFGWGWGCFSYHAQEDGGIFAGVGAPGGGIRFSPGNGPEDIPPGSAVTGRWQRFIVTYGHGIGAFYGDGRLIARKAMPTPKSHSDLYLGRGEADAQEPYSFAGDLGGLLVYDRMLDPDEVALLDRHLQGAP
jgi:ferric-dicitrate binding protein FerR (iron transport regulator)